MSTAAPSLEIMNPADTARIVRTRNALSKLQSYMSNDENAPAIRSWWAKNREQPDSQTVRALLYASCVITTIGTTVMTGSVASGVITGGVGPAVYETWLKVDRSLRERGVLPYTEFSVLKHAADKILADAPKSLEDSAYNSDAERTAAWDDINNQLEETITKIEQALDIKKD